MWVLLLTILSAAPSGPRPLTFAEAQTLAVESALPAGLKRAAETGRTWEQRLPALAGNPTLGVFPGRRAQPDSTGLEVTVSVTQPLFLSGLEGARRSAARAEVQALEQEAAAALLARRLDVARSWLTLWAAQEAVTAAEREEAMAAELRDAVARALKLGGLTKLELAEAQGYAAEAHLARLAREGDAVAARLELAALVGQAPSPLLVAEGTLPTVALPAGEEEPQWLTRAAQLPDAGARRMLAAAERARAQEAGAARGWQAQVGVQGVREYYGGFSAVATLGLTPPLFDSGQREKGALLAAAERLEGEAQDAAHRAASALALAFHEREHSAEVRAALEEQLVPTAEETARLADALFRAGQSTVVDVLRARRALAAAHARLALARADATLAAVRLHLLLASLS